MKQEKNSSDNEEKQALQKEDTGTQPAREPGRKNTAATISMVIFGIVCVSMSCLFFAVRSGKFDQEIFRHRDGAHPAQEDNGSADLAKGFAYYNGMGVPRRMEIAFSHFLDAARKGNALAQYQAGIMLSLGEGTSRDTKAALSWLRASALQGYAEARLALGALCAEGEGTPQDKAEAVNWLREAAAKGNTRAQSILKELEKDMAAETLPEEELLARAYASLEGKGVPQDKAEAARWLRKAVVKGNVDAQWRLAMLYGEGDGVPLDTDEAADWLRKAATQGHADARYQLAMICKESESVRQDIKQAAEWLRKAAEQGHAKAQYQLARMYHEGDGIPRDGKQAIYWYRKLAEEDSVSSMMAIARIYAEGDGVPRDRHTAILWYHWAAEACSEVAMLELGRIYAEGDGVPRDKLLAALWYKRLSTTYDYELEEKTRKALQELEADDRLLRDWEEVIDGVQTTRTAVARYELFRDGEKTGKTEQGRKKFAWQCFDAKRTCSRFLEETWQNLKKAGNNVPQPIRDMAAAAEAEKILSAVPAEPPRP